MVYRRKLVDRTIFKKIPHGMVYWASTGLTPVYLKCASTARMDAWHVDHHNETAVARNTAEMRIPDPFLANCA